MKIVTLCGCGLGTCFILKFTAEKALERLGLIAEIVPCSIGSCSTEHADLYLAPSGLDTSPMDVSEGYVAAIRNVLSTDEVVYAIEQYLKMR